MQINLKKIGGTDTSDIVCIAFHHVGGSFREYQWLKDTNCLVYFVELPGRLGNSNPMHVVDIEISLFEIAKSIAKTFSGKRLVFFGASMGAQLAYRLADEISKYDDIFLSSFISASAMCPRRQADHDIKSIIRSDERILDSIAKYMGADIPDEIKYSDFFSVLVSIIRQDYQLFEQLKAKKFHQLKCPVVSIHGESDGFVTSQMNIGWADFALSSFVAHTLEGNHFFTAESRKEICTIIRNQIIQLREAR